MHCPTFQDHLKLQMVVNYLVATKDLELIIRPCEMLLQCSADASFGIHADGKSHSGLVMSLGKRSAPVQVWSRKQKAVSTSSTQAELMALTEAIEEVMWMRRLLGDLGYPAILPTPMEQDNTSAMIVAQNGNKAKGRAYHVKHFWVRERVTNGDIALVHVPTELIAADGLTKPLIGSKFRQWRTEVLCVE